MSLSHDAGIASRGRRTGGLISSHDDVMRYAHTVEQVRAAEAALMATSADGALMQRAAHGLAVVCADLLAANGVYGSRVLVVAGAGNNGGDALVGRRDAGPARGPGGGAPRRLECARGGARGPACGGGPGRDRDDGGATTSSSTGSSASGAGRDSTTTWPRSVDDARRPDRGRGRAVGRRGRHRTPRRAARDGRADRDVRDAQGRRCSSSLPPEPAGWSSSSTSGSAPTCPIPCSRSCSPTTYDGCCPGPTRRRTSTRAASSVRSPGPRSTPAPACSSCPPPSRPGLPGWCDTRVRART